MADLEMKDPTLHNEARLRALLAAATQRPWFGQYEYDGARTIATMRSVDTTMCINRACHADGFPGDKTRENAALIAEAVNAIEQKLDELDRLRAVPKWQCFHCGFATSDEREAAGHFGEFSEEQPLCIVWSELDADGRASEHQQVCGQLAEANEEASKQRVAIEGLEYRLLDFENLLSSRFKGCKTMNDAFNVYDSMEGRALAAEAENARLRAEVKRWYDGAGQVGSVGMEWMEKAKALEETIHEIQRDRLQETALLEWVAEELHCDESEITQKLRDQSTENARLRAALEQIAATAGEDLEWPEVSRRTTLEIAAIAREALNAKG